MKRRIDKILLNLTVVCMALLLSVTADSATTVNKTVRLTMGKANTVNLDRPVSDILVANPAIADVGTLRSDRLYIVGKLVGDTNILAFDSEGNQLADIAVHVRIDQKTLADALKEFFPEEKVEVRTINEDIVLSGYVSNPLMANRVRDLASRFISVEGQTVVDLMTVEGEQQVMVKVKVIEAKRSILREFGVETDYRNVKDPASTTGGLLNSIAGTGLTELAPFAAGTLYISDTDRGFGPLKLSLQALERDGLVNVLAEPNLTAISGETAGFLAGGEFPVPTGRDNDGNISIEFKQFGVALNFTPTVLSKDRISLHMSTEVSDRADDDGVTLVNTQIPGLSVRKAETTVELGSGGTIMLAGLIKSDTVHTLTGLPGIQDIPILGNLFKSKSFERGESELVILVTPYLVEPYAKREAEIVAETVVPAALEHEERMNPISTSFVNNLRRVYGDRVPKGISNEKKFGYIVE